MATDMVEQDRKSNCATYFSLSTGNGWHDFADVYECRVLLCPDPDGGFSAHAIRLPGVASQGENENEALANIADAFQAVLQAYRDSGSSIPWEDARIDRPQGCLERWILVNV